MIFSPLSLFFFVGRLYGIFVIEKFKHILLRKWVFWFMFYIILFFKCNISGYCFRFRYFKVLTIYIFSFYPKKKKHLHFQYHSNLLLHFDILTPPDSVCHTIKTCRCYSSVTLASGGFEEEREVSWSGRFTIGLHRWNSIGKVSYFLALLMLKYWLAFVFPLATMKR